MFFVSCLVGVLEGLNQTERLVDTTAHRQIVDGDLPQNALVVNDEEATQGDPLVLEQHTVVARDALGQVGDDRNVHRAKTARLARRVDPRKMAKLAVNTRREYHSVKLLKVCKSVAERNNLKQQQKKNTIFNAAEIRKATWAHAHLGRAHKGEIKRVEEEHDVGAEILLQRDICKKKEKHSH